jgi:N-acetylmuramoyl-L-alanine amidase
VLRKNIVMGVSMLMLFMGVLPANAAVMHSIQKGESLYRIAVNNGTTVNQLKQANGITSNVIYPGAKLAIPASNANYNNNVNDNNHEIDLLARLITAEAGGEPFKGKVAVASVIINRKTDTKFPETIAGNIFKPHQFESVSNGLIWKQPTEDSYKAAKAALKGWDPTYGAKYFFNPAKINGPSWIWSRKIKERIGNHVFGV